MIDWLIIVGEIELLYFVIVLLLCGFIYTGLKYYQIKQKYKPFEDLNIEIDKRLDRKDTLDNEISSLELAYKTKQDQYNKLLDDYNLLDGDFTAIECGLYKLQFDFETSLEYKNKLEELYYEQKKKIKDNSALICKAPNQSDRLVKKLIKNLSKLALNYFNNECRVIINKVKWNNANQMIERIYKIYENVNEILEFPAEMEITKEYRDLKIKELQLTYEYELKKKDEKEREALFRETMKEEEKRRKEIEEAKRQTEFETNLYEKALKEIELKLQTAHETEKIRFEEEIEELKKKLEQCKENERKISEAEKGVKNGHIYVISNIGSFGKDIYKIGMTRRLEPEERVDELGNASVPFKFDIHAMIKSDNAPELEYRLHKAFENKRVNRVNLRKEFFNVSLDEIAQEVHKYNANIMFVKEPEALEFRESQEIIKQQDKGE